MLQKIKKCAELINHVTILQNAPKDKSVGWSCNRIKWVEFETKRLMRWDFKRQVTYGIVYVIIFL
jgi:hypothetical protein